MGQKRDIYDIILTLLDRKKQLIWTFIIVAVISTVVSFLLPKWYESTAKVLVAGQESALDLGAFLGNVPIDLSPQTAKSLGRMESILKSRQLLDKVIDSYNLHEVYGNKYLFETREELQEHMKIELNNIDNSVVLSFEYKENPNLAKEICAFILNSANDIYVDIQSQEARNNRIFVEKLYNEALSKLDTAEDSLKRFQQKYGTYLLDEQLKATIASQALLEQELIKAKTEYHFLSNIVNQDVGKIKEVKLRISTLENELSRLQNNVEDFSILLPLKSVPEQAIQYYKLQREITILGSVLEFLTPQYEKAVIEENRKSPSFFVLDKPLLPEYKSRPKRALVIIGITGTVMIFYILLILLKAHLLYVESTDERKYNKWKKLLHAIYIKI